MAGGSKGGKKRKADYIKIEEADLDNCNDSGDESNPDDREVKKEPAVKSIITADWIRAEYEALLNSKKSAPVVVEEEEEEVVYEDEEEEEEQEEEEEEDLGLGIPYSRTSPVSRIPAYGGPPLPQMTVPYIQAPFVHALVAQQRAQHQQIIQAQSKHDDHKSSLSGLRNPGMISPAFGVANSGVHHSGILHHQYGGALGMLGEAKPLTKPLYSGGSDRYKHRTQRVEWTHDLHQKFLEALHKLGERAAVPKAIIEEMNVPYLTREKVASHLQKYRQSLEKNHLMYSTRRNTWDQDGSSLASSREGVSSNSGNKRPKLTSSETQVERRQQADSECQTVYRGFGGTDVHYK